jgi:hypothetical protein
MSVATTAAIVKGSVRLTAKSWPASARLASSAAATPTTAPMATGFSACPIISRMTLADRGSSPYVRQPPPPI